MRKPALLILFATACLLPALKGDDKPDLSGNWNLNVARSKFGRMPKPQTMTLQCTRKGEGYHSVQTTDDGQGKKSVEGDWLLDGKDHSVEAEAAANKMTQMSKWDGKTLVADRKSADGSYVENTRLTFSADGKTATERLSVKSPNGSNTATLVWERK